MNPFGFYFRGRLHRKIFFWFGISIAVTTLVVFLAAMKSHPGGWGFERARTFLAGQLAESWDDPPRRDALATAVAKDLAIDGRGARAAGP